MFKIKVLLMSALIALPALASGEQRGLSAGIGLGYSSIADSSFEPTIAPVATLSQEVASNISAEVSIGWEQYKGKTDTSGGKAVFSPDIFIIPLQGTVKASYPINLFSPYIGAGVGVYYSDAALSGDQNAYIKQTRTSDPNFDMSVGGGGLGLGFQIATGCDYRISRNVSIGLDIRYRNAMAAIITETKTSVGTQKISKSLDISSVNAGLGIKYFF